MTPSGFTALQLATMDPAEFEARSLAAVEAGQLPLRAQQRLADATDFGAWTSDLSVAEFDVLGSVGFRPVGQVLGTSVYRIGWTGTNYCGGGGRWGGGFSPAPTNALPLIQSLYDARSRALTRMQAEAVALGADGVVGVELTISNFVGAQSSLEFHAIGTAVRADGPVHPPLPFLSDLSGQDFVKLLRSGWVPTGIAMGIAVVVRHDDWNTRMQAGSWSNAEVSGYTELIQGSRHNARVALATDVAPPRRRGCRRTRHDGAGARADCSSYGNEGRDHVAEVTVLGTAITRFTKSRAHDGPRTLPILRVGTARPTGGST